MPNPPPIGNTGVILNTEFRSMRYLTDQREQAVMLLHQNILLNRFGTEMLGVILGNCVFDADGSPRAKFFHNTLYNMDGRIMARETGTKEDLIIDAAVLMNCSWEIVYHIKDHNCPMIEPLNEWSTVPAAEHFSGIAIPANAIV